MNQLNSNLKRKETMNKTISPIIKNEIMITNKEEEGGSQQEEERENTAGSVVVVVEGCLQPFHCLFLSIMFPPIVYPVSVVGGWG